jgi:hypothetical protein
MMTYEQTGNQEVIKIESQPDSGGRVGDFARFMLQDRRASKVGAYLASLGGTPGVVMHANPYPRDSDKGRQWAWDAKIELIREGLREWAGAHASKSYRGLLKGTDGADIGSWLDLGSEIRWEGPRGKLTGKGLRLEERWAVSDPVALVWLSALRGIQSGWLGVCSNCGNVFRKESAREIRFRRCSVCRKQPYKAREKEIRKRRPAFHAWRKAYEVAYFYTHRRKPRVMSKASFEKWQAQAKERLPDDPASRRDLGRWERHYDPRKFCDLGQPRIYTRRQKVPRRNTREATTTRQEG